MHQFFKTKRNGIRTIQDIGFATEVNKNNS